MKGPVKISDETMRHYRTKGYAIVRQAVARPLIASLFDALAGVFKKFNADAPVFAGGWEDPEFHARMARFRIQRPKDFGLMYDTVQTAVALWRLGTHETLASLAAQFMGDHSSALTVTDMLLRMDAPSDSRNRLEWHQDSSYFRQNKEGKNGCVCSITLRDLAPEQGPLELLPQSHALGRIEVPSEGKNDAITSEQFRVPDDLVAKYRPVPVIVKATDAVFFNFDLIHRSGRNVSDTFRFTAIARFHRMLDRDFVPGRLVYRPSRAGGD